MSYTPHNFVSGQVLTAAAMNEIDAQVVLNETASTNAAKTATTTSAASTQMYPAAVSSLAATQQLKTNPNIYFGSDNEMYVNAEKVKHGIFPVTDIVPCYRGDLVHRLKASTAIYSSDFSTLYVFTKAWVGQTSSTDCFPYAQGTIGQRTANQTTVEIWTRTTDMNYTFSESKTILGNNTLGVAYDGTYFYLIPYVSSWNMMILRYTSDFSAMVYFYVALSGTKIVPTGISYNRSDENLYFGYKTTNGKYQITKCAVPTLSASASTIAVTSVGTVDTWYTPNYTATDPDYDTAIYPNGDLAVYGNKWATMSTNGYLWFGTLSPCATNGCYILGDTDDTGRWALGEAGGIEFDANGRLISTRSTLIDTSIAYQSNAIPTTPTIGTAENYLEGGPFYTKYNVRNKWAIFITEIHLGTTTFPAAGGTSSLTVGKSTNTIRNNAYLVNPGVSLVTAYNEYKDPCYRAIERIPNAQVLCVANAYTYTPYGGYLAFNGDTNLMFEGEIDATGTTTDQATIFTGRLYLVNGRHTWYNKYPIDTTNTSAVGTGTFDLADRWIILDNVELRMMNLKFIRFISSQSTFATKNYMFYAHHDVMPASQLSAISGQIGGESMIYYTRYPSTTPKDVSGSTCYIYSADDASSSAGGGIQSTKWTTSNYGLFMGSNKILGF